LFGGYYERSESLIADGASIDDSDRVKFDIGVICILIRKTSALYPTRKQAPAKLHSNQRDDTHHIVYRFLFRGSAKRC